MWQFLLELDTLVYNGIFTYIYAQFHRIFRAKISLTYSEEWGNRSINKCRKINFQFQCVGLRYLHLSSFPLVKQVSSLMRIKILLKKSLFNQWTSTQWEMLVHLVIHLSDARLADLHCRANLSGKQVWISFPQENNLSRVSEQQFQAMPIKWSITAQKPLSTNHRCWWPFTGSLALGR